MSDSNGPLLVPKTSASTAGLTGQIGAGVGNRTRKMPGFKPRCVALRHARNGGPCRCRPGLSALRTRHPRWKTNGPSGSRPRCRSVSLELQRLRCVPTQPAKWKRMLVSIQPSSAQNATRLPRLSAKLVPVGWDRTSVGRLQGGCPTTERYRHGVNDGDRTRTFSFTERRADHYTTNTINHEGRSLQRLRRHQRWAITPNAPLPGVPPR